MADTRNKQLDILKGLAIIVVVMIHASMPIMKWLQLVQMQVFFIASGFFYNASTIETKKDMKNYLVKRIKTLYLPCFLWSITITLLHNVLVDGYLIIGEEYNIRQLVCQCIKCVLFSGGGQLSGTIWFLRTMFCSSILYMIIDYTVKRSQKKKVLRWIICLLFLVIGWMADVIGIPGKQYFNIFSVLFLYELGREFRELKIVNLCSKMRFSNNLLIGVIAALILCLLKEMGGIAVNNNIITNPIYFIVCSVIGWILFVVLSNIISNVRYISEVLSYIGKHTLSIMLFHFASFKIVTYFQIRVYNMGINKLESFPCLITEDGWWCVYTIVGLVSPLLLSMLFAWGKSKVIYTR